MAQAQPLVLIALVVIGLILIFQRKTSNLIGFILLAIVAIVLVFNATGLKDILLQLGNKVIGS